MAASKPDAAYFAFANAEQNRSVALYVYLETPNKAKVQPSAGTPYITPVDHHITTNKRHFLQRSRYSTCLRYDGRNWLFVPHQEVLNVNDTNQDVLWRFVIPSTERAKVLRRLDRLNLNAYSLFGSEESLMETLAFREIDERQ